MCGQQVKRTRNSKVKSTITVSSELMSSYNQRMLWDKIDVELPFFAPCYERSGGLTYPGYASKSQIH